MLLAGFAAPFVFVADQGEGVRPSATGDRCLRVGDRGGHAAGEFVLVSADPRGYRAEFATEFNGRAIVVAENAALDVLGCEIDDVLPSRHDILDGHITFFQFGVDLIEAVQGTQAGIAMVLDVLRLMPVVQIALLRTGASLR